MVFATVFRHVPPPIVGTIGTLYDRAFETFEANLDWLETTGVLVERFDPATAERLYTYVYSAGGTRDFAEAYRLFRGHDPDIAGLLKRRGLVGLEPIEDGGAI